MAVGDVVHLAFVRQADPQTGAVVERLTDDVGRSHHPYFTQPVLTADGRHVLVAGDRSGAWQMHAIDLAERRMVQLTDEPHVRAGASCLDPQKGLCYYWAGRTLCSVGLDGADRREHYTCPEGYGPTILSISACGRYLAFAYVERIPTSTGTGAIYSTQQESLFQSPRSVLLRLDLQTGVAQALYGEPAWYSHVSIDPTDAACVLFNHEGAWQLVQRMWIARADTMEVWPLLPTRRLLQQCGHECFTSRGTVVTQYAEREHVRQEPWRHANVTMKPDGSDVRYFWYDCFQPGHVQTSHGDESLLVGDCGPRKDVHDAEGAAWLSLVRLADGRSRLTPLCRHGSSWKTQSSHPHPVFFLDDRWVLFSSDRGGRENVYRVQLRVES